MRRQTRRIRPLPRYAARYPWPWRRFYRAHYLTRQSWLRRLSDEPLDAEYLRRYLQRLREYPLPAMAEQSELLRQYQQSGDPVLLRRLVLPHLYSAAIPAAVMPTCARDRMDMLQEANLGILDILRLPPREGGLRARVAWRIYVRIKAHQRHLRSVVTLRSQEMCTLYKYWAALRSGDTPEEAAGRIGRPLPQLLASQTRFTDLDASLETDFEETAEEGLHRNCLPDPRPDPEAAAADAEIRSRMIAALEREMAKLTPRQQLVLRGRFLTEPARPLEDLGRELGISREGVRQVEIGALARLHGVLEGMSPWKEVESDRAGRVPRAAARTAGTRGAVSPVESLKWLLGPIAEKQGISIEELRTGSRFAAVKGRRLALLCGTRLLGLKPQTVCRAMGLSPKRLRYAWATRFDKSTLQLVREFAVQLRRWREARPGA